MPHSFDQNLGGRDFDEVSFNHFIAQFNEKHKIDVYSNARASLRLRASCEKVKKVLSANAEAPLSIECLIGDTDLRGIVTREEFENLSSKLLERKEPTRTLNASEGVARGCALRCATLSPTLIVRDYKIGSSEPFDEETAKVEFRVKLNAHGIVEIDSATILEDKRHSSWKMILTANTHTSNLPASVNLDISTTNDELHEAKEKEKKLTKQDIKVEETKDQRNSLESFVYDTRSKVLVFS
ncbi:putative Heat shock protein 70 family [Helianthus annuus]|nr:putative Heat shock protein 70 family [Helianthus annuus]